MTLFLLVMVGLAFFGRLRFPTRKPRLTRRACPRCGRPQVGPGRCPCEKV
ncbi:hypothetical protein [Rhodobacter viridis]|nr:hypothetical protein [Rhodobacter viridis]